MDADVARTLVQSHGKRLNVYRCKRCNFRSKVFSALPGSCRRVGEFTPNRTGKPNKSGVNKTLLALLHDPCRTSLYLSTAARLARIAERVL